MSLAVVTANRLADGRVVYLGEQGWSTHIGKAAIADSEVVAAALLAVGQAAAAAREVVSPYLIDVAEAKGVPRPTLRRERVRAAGPTVRPDLGYQAEQEA